MIVGSSRLLTIGALVTAIGFPLDTPWLPALDNAVQEEPTEAESWRFGFKNSGVDNGNSGGPVFLSDGQLVGIVHEKGAFDAVARQTQRRGAARESASSV
jgi:S1-C subfamily serine protease